MTVSPASKLVGVARLIWLLLTLVVVNDDDGATALFWKLEIGPAALDWKLAGVATELDWTLLGVPVEVLVNVSGVAPGSLV